MKAPSCSWDFSLGVILSRMFLVPREQYEDLLLFRQEQIEILSERVQFLEGSAERMILYCGISEEER